MAFSCKNSIDNKNTKKGYGVISFTSSARTVQENFNVETFTDICLFGKNEEESKFVSLKSWDKYENFLSDSLSIAVGSYEFYITAKIGNVGFKSDVVSVDIAESSINIINFKVYVTDRGTGKGTVNLEFTFGEGDYGFPVTKGSFELNKITYENNKRKESTVTIAPEALVVTPIDNSTGAAASATFNAVLDSGVYELISRFENPDWGVAVYPVTIHISEGQTSSDEIEVLNFNPFYGITYYDGETPIAGLNNTYYPTKYSIYDEVEFPRYEKSYYEFEGWYTDSSFTNKIETIDKYEFAEDLSLYAKWKLDESQYLLFNQSEAFNVVMQDNVANKEQLGKDIYSDFTIGGGDFFYYLSDNSLKKSNDDNFSEQAYFQEGQIVFPIDMLYYEYGADKIHGLSIDDEINNDYHSYYDFKNKKQLYFDYSYKTELGMIQDFAVSSNTLYLLYFGTDTDSQTNYFIHVYDIREDAIKDISVLKGPIKYQLPAKVVVNAINNLKDKRKSNAETKSTEIETNVGGFSIEPPTQYADMIDNIGMLSSSCPDLIVDNGKVYMLKGIDA